jgi:hypothetical protein
MTNKELANEIARSCKIPIDDARKLLYIILETLVNGIKKDKILKIKSFGRWTLWRPSRTHLPDGRFVPAVKWRCDFSPKGSLSVLLRNKYFKTYAWTLANKYARLNKQGDIKGAKKTKKMLKAYLRGKWSMARWLDERGRLPYPLWKKRSDDV